LRRFSQRSSLVTLSEINITPLRFGVCALIIFVITTLCRLEVLYIKLPTEIDRQAHRSSRPPNVDINQKGQYFFDKRQMSLTKSKRNWERLQGEPKYRGLCPRR
jgi:biopolymer transport protein ExbD